MRIEKLRSISVSKLVIDILNYLVTRKYTKRFIINEIAHIIWKSPSIW